MQQTHTPSVLIVAHGSPSDPEVQEDALAALAAKVDALLPDIQVSSATLAAPGRFEAAVEKLGAPLLYPFFMADGYFVGRVIGKKAEALGLSVLPPFGHEPALTDTIMAALTECLAANEWHAKDTALLVAAHGSAVSEKNAETTKALTSRLESALGFSSAHPGFVEQEPFLGDAAQDLGQAICLPFFALRAGHYIEDVPDALASAAFSGPLLPPFIEWPQTPALIAQSLRTHVTNA
ncbi:sirohydrochlorin chelatase [Shimia aestuarii]|uniref:sirohydrochlorin chelatase n=1 Tax=Shimia aestuarii TaxID=254406 RepID=UPI001FB4D15B|nr:CbiX/SirB N-terminal domain-containing protein [Shimia aestuarii]